MSILLQIVVAEGGDGTKPKWEILVVSVWLHHYLASEVECSSPKHVVIKAESQLLVP